MAFSTCAELLDTCDSDGVEVGRLADAGTLTPNMAIKALGMDGNHLETDPTDPVTVYGKTMVAAEKLIASQRPQSCVMRISLPMGISFNGHAGAIDWIQSRFAKNKEN